MAFNAKRFIRAIFISIIALVLGLIAVLYTILYLSLPPREGNLELEGPKKNIEITFDEMGLPQIWATGEHDAWFALGYLHASDRLFQMELIRRLSQGRISELLGESTLDDDIRQRRIGHTRRANQALSELSEENRTRLQAYVDGINVYRNECQALPFEFYLLQIDDQDWTIFDCLTIQSFQTWFSDALLNRDRFYMHLLDKVGIDKAQTLQMYYPDWAPVTIDNDEVTVGDIDSPLHEIIEIEKDANANYAIPRQKPSLINTRQLTPRSQLADWLYRDSQTPLLMSTSSNAWAVAPSRSASGNAMLASDPHLEVARLPQFWYYVGVHIKTPQTDVLGISVPGLPFVIMGHNGQVAYAFTAGGVDITDYYIEEINPDDSSKYKTDKGWTSFERYADTLWAAGVDTPIVINIDFTRHGPLFIDDSLKLAYSLYWAGDDINLDLSISAGFDLHRVSNFDQFRKVVTSLGALDANWVYADSAGNIGYQLGTPIPIRSDQTQNFPLSGSAEENYRTGYYPLENTPHIINPSTGWVGSCNNLAQREGLSYQVPGNYFPDRILRLSQLLESKDKYNVFDMWTFQMDRHDAYLMRWAKEVADLLEQIEEPVLATTLRNWDGSTSKESSETLLLEMFLSQLTKLTFEDDLGDLTKQVRPIWMDKIYHSTDTFWFDDISSPDHYDTRNDIALEALLTTLITIRSSDSTDNNSSPVMETWGDRHTLTIRHPMAVVPFVGSLLNLQFGPWPWSGTAGTLNASFFSEDSSIFRSFVGPSWRFVIDFGSIDSATICLPAGNSGNPISDHFFNFNSMWQNGERWVVPITYDKVRERSATTLMLKSEDRSG